MSLKEKNNTGVKYTIEMKEPNFRMKAEKDRWTVYIKKETINKAKNIAKKLGISENEFVEETLRTMIASIKFSELR